MERDLKMNEFQMQLAVQQNFHDFEVQENLMKLQEQIQKLYQGQQI